MKKITLLLFFILNFLIFSAYAIELDLTEKKVGNYSLPLIDFHGFIGQTYAKSTDNNFLADTQDGTFDFREMGLNMSMDISNNLRFGTQVFARKMGTIGDDKITLDYSYFDYNFTNWLAIDAGRMKMAHGLYNETRDVDALRTYIFLPGVYFDFARDTLIGIDGAGINGNIGLGFLGNINYQARGGTMVLPDDGGVAKFFSGTGMMEVDNFDAESNGSQNYSLVWNTPLKGLRFGSTLITGEFDINGTRTGAFGDIPGDPILVNYHSMEISVYSIEYTWENLVLSSEYMELDADMTFPAPIPEMKQAMGGYYFGASYRLNELFELGILYSIYYPDREDKDGDNNVARGMPDYSAWLKDWGFSVRYDINEYLILKLEHHIMNGTAMMFAQDNPEGTIEDWDMTAAKLSFTF